MNISFPNNIFNGSKLGLLQKKCHLFIINLKNKCEHLPFSSLYYFLYRLALFWFIINTLSFIMHIIFKFSLITYIFLSHYSVRNFYLSCKKYWFSVNIYVKDDVFIRRWNKHICLIWLSILDFPIFCRCLFPAFFVEWWQSL